MEVERLREELALLNKAPDQEDMSCILLKGLPESWSTFRQIHEAKTETYAELKTTILIEVLKAQQHGSQAGLAMHARTDQVARQQRAPNASGTEQSKFLGNCFTCGKKGHRAVECRSKKGKNKGDGRPGFSFMTPMTSAAALTVIPWAETVRDLRKAGVINVRAWVVDTGAAQHQCITDELVRKQNMPKGTAVLGQGG